MTKLSGIRNCAVPQAEGSVALHGKGHGGTILLHPCDGGREEVETVKPPSWITALPGSFSVGLLAAGDCVPLLKATAPPITAVPTLGSQNHSFPLLLQV